MTAGVLHVVNLLTCHYDLTDVANQTTIRLKVACRPEANIARHDREGGDELVGTGV